LFRAPRGLRGPKIDRSSSVTHLGSLLPRSFRSLFRAPRGLRGPKIDLMVVGHRQLARPW
jgi:hypothetical protein